MKKNVIFLILVSLSYFVFTQNQAVYRSGQLIVQYKSLTAFNESASLRSKLAVKRMGAIPSLQIELWGLPENCELSNKCLIEVPEWIDYLQRNEAAIGLVQPNYIYGSGSLPPNDTAFFRQWYLHNTGFNGCPDSIDIGALAAWDIRNNAKYAKVGILDTGIEWNHPDLKDNIWQNLGEDADNDSTTIVWNGSTWVFDPGDINGIDDDNNGYIDDVIGWDFIHNDNNPMDDNGHGTHVAGIIGAKSNNTTGIAGIAGAGIQMMPLKCLDESGTGYSYTILLALQYSINQGAMVTNHSYGGGAYDSLMFSYIDNNCKNAGQLMIAAAGNNHVNNDLDPMYPASYDSDIIISVGAHDCSGNPSSCSNFGSNSVDIFAPGEAIISADLNGQYSFRTGTSMAAPMVTAAVALAWKQFPASNPMMIKNRILNTATLDNGLNNLCVSNGRLNLYDALRLYNDEALGTNTGEWIFSNSQILNLTTEGDWLWGIMGNKGIFKYNIYTRDIIYYNSTNSGLPSDICSKITVDGSGNKWIFWDYYVTKFDNNSWQTHSLSTNFPLYFSLPSSSVSLAKCDKNNNIWIASNNGGLYKYNGSTLIVLNAFNGFGINDLSVDTLNNIWVATTDGLYKLDSIGNITATYNTSNAPFYNNVALGIDIDKQNNIWVATPQKLLKYDGNNWQFYTDTLLNNVQVTRILIDTIGNKYLYYEDANYTSKLIKFNGNSFSLCYSFPPANNYKCITLGQDNSPWLGGRFGSNSLAKYNIITDSCYFFNLPILSNIINVPYYTTINKLLYIDSKNKKWFSYNNNYVAPSNGGAIAFDIDTTIIYDKTLLGLSSNNIECMVEDRNANMWFCTSSGELSKFNPQSNIYNVFNISTTTQTIKIDSLNRAWIATNNGLVRIDSGNIMTFNINQNNFPLQFVKDIEFDRLGNLWAIGLDINNFNFLVKIDMQDSVFSWNLSGIWGNNIAIDSYNTLWLGTDSLRSFDGANWTTYDLNPILGFSPNINYITIDKNNNKWITCSNSPNGSDVILKFNGSNYTIYGAINHSIPNGILGKVIIDNKNNKWLSIKDGIGSAGSAFILFDITPTFSTPTFTTCLNSSLTFTNQTTDADSFTWKVDNQIVDTATHLTYTFNTAGVKRVELIAHKGTLDKSFFQYITVRTPVEVNLGKDTSLCHSSFVISANAAAETYLWKNLSGTLLDPDSVNETFTVTGSGLHIIVLEAIDYCGALDRDTIMVTLTGDCVLPGDVNSDGGVDILDFIALQPLVGDTGISRPNASTILSYQSCPNWGANQPGTSIDKKHGDCDGDGIINLFADGAVIYQNATRTMRPQKGTDSTVYELKLKRVNYNPYQWFRPGDTIWHNVELSREDGLNLTNIQRMAFNVRYNQNIIEEPVFKLNNSFMGMAGINLFPMVIRKGKRVDFGEIRILGSSTGAPKSNTGQVGTTPKSERIDTTHTTHSIFLTMTLNNASLTLNNGSKERIHSQTSQNTETMEIRLPWNRLDLTIYLDGAYDSTAQVMRTDLQSQNLIPSKHPYGDIAPFKEVEIPVGVVDWVEVQLRSAANPTLIVDRRAAFLMEDGHIQSPYSADSGNFYMIAKPGNYYVVVKHRNHLAVMSQTALTLIANPAVSISYDFTSNAGYGVNGQKTVANQFAMWAGDTDGNGIIEYLNVTDDRAAIFTKLEATNDKTYIKQGYYMEDVNLDGRIQYSGAGNDRALILLNLGGTNVNASISSQVPQ